MTNKSIKVMVQTDPYLKNKIKNDQPLSAIQAAFIKASKN